MAATMRATYWSGAGPSATTAEGGFKFNREETVAGTTPIPKPNATGTNYSYNKPISLEVTGADAGTSTSNRRIHRSSAPAAGITMWMRDDADTYQRGNAVAAADNGTTNDATPSGYSAMPSSATVYDAASDSNAATGRSGDYVSVAVGISNLYLGGAGSAVAVPNIVLTYDES
jgi:hypothetical protein